MPKAKSHKIIRCNWGLVRNGRTPDDSKWFRQNFALFRFWVLSNAQARIGHTFRQLICLCIFENYCNFSCILHFNSAHHVKGYTVPQNGQNVWSAKEEQLGESVTVVQCAPKRRENRAEETGITWENATEGCSVNPRLVKSSRKINFQWALVK